ncbi:MAG TPA: SRPBCC domain-containing protein [Nitrososphaera sp.]|nr:SRPBCC domain-containing protein [Nitrososphaera sp.]
MSRARIGDDAIQARTGRNWQQWFSVLDKAGAMKMSHKEMADYLYGEKGVPGWWCQMIVVRYEQDRGLRNKYERLDGYSVSVSKTIEVPVSVLYKQWINEKLRKQWLKNKLFTVRKTTENKSMRITWNDNDSNINVEVNFYRKGKSKSQVVVQHNRLADSKQVDHMRSYWKAALDRLKAAST